MTIGAIVGMAAHLDGRAASVMDQIGLAQKGGEVTSHIRIAQNMDALGPVRFAPGEADTLIGCDIAMASNPDVMPLLAADAVAVVNDHVVMTGDFTSNPDAIFPLELMKRRIGRAAQTTFADLAGLAARQFGDAAGANMMALGMAWQKGRVPVSRSRDLPSDRAQRRGGRDEQGGVRLGPCAGRRSPFRRVDARFAGSESRSRARRHRQGPRRRTRPTIKTRRWPRAIARWSSARAGGAADRSGSTEFAEAVARSFFKLLAYKDEYEVARLHVASGFLAKLAEDHNGGSLVFHMSPPLFAGRDPVTGHARKMRLGSWMLPLLRILSRLKFLRGTWADPFGATAERRAERRAIDDYERLIGERIIPGLAAHNRTSGRRDFGPSARRSGAMVM